VKQNRLIACTAIVVVGLPVVWVDVSWCARVVQKPPVPDFTRGGRRGESHDWTLGPTGARGWVYGRKGQTSDARQILVTAVAKGSPADGVLREGDVILGD